MTGVVFDIRELTVHDGPGLRTTVFLKGCPLRCAWCHNPEGLEFAAQVLRNPTGARVAGRSYTAAELAGILNRQAPLLGELGGVTFSGGEPLAQASFVAETIAHLAGLHVTLGTSGFATEADFRLVASRCDLVLFDVKLMDREAHRRWTGVDNDAIQHNLDVLATMGKPYVLRVPLVPGVTDTEGNLGAVAERASALPGRPRVELLPYNRAAGGKYAACGLAWKPAYDEAAPVNPRLNYFTERNVQASVL